MSFGKAQIDYDAIIIGAGISGICFAKRLQDRCPHLRYCILEKQGGIGGTWRRFKYPGLRCDSDMFTFGFPWRPWQNAEAVAEGPVIVDYMKCVAAESGIDGHMQFDTDVKSIHWSSKSQTWITSIERGSRQSDLVSRFVFLATGYFDHEEPLKAAIPGLGSFRGDVVHPQFWPAELDYTDKEMVVIGSGATAITLIPALGKRARQVTMLQRSPAFITSTPIQSRLEKVVRAVAPVRVANWLIRMKWILWSTIFRVWCIQFPAAGRRMLERSTLAQLPPNEKLDPNFTPLYKPFEQRLCKCPDGDFFRAIRDGKANVKTGVIDKVTEDKIRLRSGEELQPDIIVTATGLKLRVGGGIDVRVDGASVSLNERFVWKGLMLEGLPNFIFSFGYFDLSWTLGVDTSAQLACSILNRMGKVNAAVAVPRRSDADIEGMEERQLTSLKSTYVEQGKSDLPKVGDRPQWGPRSWYLWEQLDLRFGDIQTGLHLSGSVR